MSDLEQIHIKAREHIWKSLAQSGRPLQSIPQEELEILIDAFLKGAQVLIDESLADAGLPGRGGDALTETLESQEKILWEGRPFLSILTHYQITNERVRIIRGLLGKDRDDIELVRIQDIDLKQGIVGRILGIGDIIIRSADPSMPQAVLSHVKESERVHEILRRAMLRARKRFRYSVQEEM